MDWLSSQAERLRRSLPPGLLGMLALVLAVECLVTASRRELARFQGLGTQFAVGQVATTARDSDVLTLGDSQLKLGFDPAEFARRAHLRAYNLAVPGTPPPLSHALLARALAAGARPRAVVFGHMTLGGEPRANLGVFAEVFGPAESAELAWASRDAGLAGAILTRRGLPSLRYRDSLRARVRDCFVRRGPPTRVAHFSQVQFVWDKWEANRGAQLIAEGDPFAAQMEPELERRLYNQPWTVQPVFASYVRRTAALAEAYDIPVFWVIAPINPEAQASRDVLGLDASHTRNLQAALTRAGKVTVLDARRCGFPASEFFDAFHLNDQGAKRLTAILARAVADRLAAGSAPGGATPPRWVDLGRYERESSRIAAEASGRERR